MFCLNSKRKNEIVQLLQDYSMVQIDKEHESQNILTNLKDGE